MSSIDVIIPVYNRAHVVARAIDSALAQQPAGEAFDLRVIVIDDGSRDDLAGALARYGEAVRCLRLERNGGAAAARNAGIAASDADYIALLDSDDLWLPGKLAAQLAFMRANGHAASCTAYYLERAGLPDVLAPGYRTGSLTHADMIWGCRVSPGATLLCERKLFETVGLLDTAFKRLEDWDWLLRLTRQCDLGFLAEPLARIDVGPQYDVARVVESIERMKQKYFPTLPPREVRKLAAALELERAAAHYRAGRTLFALPAVLKSWLLMPTGNAALAAVLRNRFVRP
jgi:glycosyltransferase involved in cell wall biosynthesis